MTSTKASTEQGKPLPPATLGGVFLATRNVARLAQWYRELGVPVGPDGMCVLDAEGAPAKSPASGFVFSIMPAQGELPGAGGDLREEPYGRQRAMINVRVTDLEVTLEGLKARDIPAVGPKDAGYGLFAWVKDPDGNLVELWQPGKQPL